MAFSTSHKTVQNKSNLKKNKNQTDKCQIKSEIIMESDLLLQEFDRYFSQLHQNESAPEKTKYLCNDAFHRATSFPSLSVINKSLKRSSNDQVMTPPDSPITKATEEPLVAIQQKLFERKVHKENSIAKSSLLTQPLSTTTRKSQQDVLIDRAHSLQEDFNEAIEVLHRAISDVRVDHQATAYQFVINQHDLDVKKYKNSRKYGSRFFGKYSYLALLPRNLFQAFRKAIWHKKHSMISYTSC